ncbi:MAG: PilZ domain protein [Candidatus Omnitrophica bacterium ADurb.Bin277]|nr:MAG: PilZ domain protein [Candidatus Omnitrophica bacterium ADurb.Bin277]
MWDGFNKRKFRRLHLNCEIVLRPQGKEKLIKAVTEDVGLGGVSVMLDQPIERFHKCQITLDLKDGASPIQCAGRGVWVVPSRDLRSSKKTYDTGIEFLDLDELSRQRLQLFLAQSI